jgi:hypothetical protein
MTNGVPMSPTPSQLYYRYLYYRDVALNLCPVLSSATPPWYQIIGDDMLWSWETIEQMVAIYTMLRAAAQS